MNDKRTAFAELLAATIEVYGVKLSKQATSIWWNCLERFDIEDVRRALSAHIQDPAVGHFAPKPADIIGRLTGNDEHLPVEDAWAEVAPLLRNEAQSIVWTDPMREAFFVAARLADDPVAARMAFKDAYLPRVAKARAIGADVVWTLSPGSDAASRDLVIQDAVDKGRMTTEHAQCLLATEQAPALPDPVADLMRRITTPPKLATFPESSSDEERAIHPESDHVVGASHKC